VGATSAARAAIATLWVLSVIAGLLFLRTAHELLIPVVIAILLSYALAPLVNRMERANVHRAIGAGVVVAALVAAVSLGLYAVRNQILDAMGALPEAAQRIARWLGAGDSARQVEEVTRSPQFIERSAGLILAGAGHVAVVIFLLFFLLMSGEHFKRRLLDVAEPHLRRRRITAEVLDEIEDQIQRYLIVTAFTSAVVGVSTWAILTLMDVRQAIVWGMLAGIFNSIPYFGPVIVSGGLLVVGLLQFGDPVSALKISAASVAVTSVEGWILTPLLLGKAEHMHVVVVFLGVLLWTWLWGAWGTVLAVPMMAVVKSICDHVEALRPISRLMAR
jgi:predicted PurR-regulated permease PerM